MVTRAQVTKKRHVRLVAHLPEAIYRAIRLEAVERRMTLGALIEEAFASRVVYTRKGSAPDSADRRVSDGDQPGAETDEAIRDRR